MKVAISAEGKDMDSQVSSVFGRCHHFILVEFEEGEVVDSDFLENSAAAQSSGAGTAAAQLIGDQDVDVLVLGAVGPKAYSALKQWDIEVYEGESGTVSENLDKLSSGKLTKVESPTAPAHRGMG